MTKRVAFGSEFDAAQSLCKMIEVCVLYKRVSCTASLISISCCLNESVSVSVTKLIYFQSNSLFNYLLIQLFQ